MLKPGERIFLERFLDDDKKYKFDVLKILKTTIQITKTT